MTPSKSIWMSKTLWAGVLTIALGLSEVLPATHWTQAGLGIVIIVLRLVTTKAVAVKQ